MAIAIVEDLWSRIRAHIDDKIVAAEDAAASAEADRAVVEQAATSASWSGDRLTVLGATSPSLKGEKGEKGDPGDVLWSELTPALDGKADLVGGFVPTSQLPAVALTKPQVVSDRAGMLALTAQEGDVAVITAGADKGTYMLGSGSPTAFSSWVQLATPAGAVSSVNGQTGVVNLSASDVGAAPSSHTHTSAQVSDATSSPTASMVMKRDGAGRASVADPAKAGDVSTKNYVDVSIINAPKLHTWDGTGSWVAPANAGPNDLVLNTATKEIFSVQVV